VKDRRQAIGVIEDDASVRKALLRLLRTAGLEVCLFETAEDFLAASDPHDFGCLVIDVRLPGMDGLELLERVRRAGPQPALVITAHDDRDACDRALAAGAVGFFRKPCDNRQLLAAIFRVLEPGALDR
jgi:FixJ family two-component response regulator